MSETPPSLPSDNKSAGGASPRGTILPRLLGLDMVATDYDTFEEYASELTLSFFRVALLLGMVAAVLRFTVDRVVAPRTSNEAFVTGQTQLIILSVIFIGFLTISTSRWSRVFRVRALMVLLTLAMTLAYGSISRNGTLATPWSWSLLGNVFMTSMFLISLPERVLFNTAMAGGALVGTVIGNPDNLTHPFLPPLIALTVFFSFLSGATGVKFMTSAEQNYYATIESDLARKQVELERQHALALAEAKANEAAQAVFERQFAQDAEQRRIAHDLHDELGHGIVQLHLEIQDCLEGEDLPPHLQTRVQTFLAKLQHIDQGVHRVVKALRDESLPRGAVAPMVRETIRRALLNWKVESQILVEPEDLHLNDSLYSFTFRVLQECLNNTLKYAQASRVEVTITADEHGLTVFYYDDGVGFDATKSSPGFGLRGMEERTRQLHGRITVHSRPGEGFELTIIVPLEVA